MKNNPPFIFVLNRANNSLNRIKVTIDELPDEIYVTKIYVKNTFFCSAQSNVLDILNQFFFEKNYI